MNQIREGGRRTFATLRRGWKLLGFAFYLLLWSKVFKGHRFLAPVEAALLATKGVERLPPELEVTDSSGYRTPWSRGFAAVQAALFLNLRNPDNLSRSRYAQPAPSFRAIYLWDSAFIAQVWRTWDVDVACDVLRAVVELRRGDRLPHFVSDLGDSKFTQPPLIAWSLAALAGAVAPERFTAWAREFYPPLNAYHKWLYAHRRLDNGLFAWAHPYESGVENAPRFSSRDEHRLDDTQVLGAPDFCAYMVLQCEALEQLALALGDAAAAADHARQREQLAAAVNQHLWDEEDGLYYDRDVATGRLIKSRTIASLLPLWAGIPDAVRAERLCSHVLDREAFNTLMPLPTVARNDPAFEKDMWRGPVWLNTAYAVVMGLRRYGYHDHAADFAYRLCDGVYRTFAQTGHLHEFYDPERYDISELHRKRGNLWKRMTLGPQPVTEFVGWSGLVNTMVTETLLGLHRHGDGLCIVPRFPPAAAGQTFSLALPNEDIIVELQVLAEGVVRGTLRSGMSERPLSAGFGERVVLAASATAGGVA